MKILLLLLLLITLSTLSFAESDFYINTKIGGDIFTDFNEDLEAAKVIEDERFFRYGRFFSFTVGIGLTIFDGNRGAAYENDPPTFGMGMNYFLDFQRSFGLGLEFSKHHMIFDTPTRGYEINPIGLIDVSLLRVYFSYRYYIDTTNLGTVLSQKIFLSQFTLKSI